MVGVECSHHCAIPACKRLFNAPVCRRNRYKNSYCCSPHVESECHYPWYLSMTIYIFAFDIRRSKSAISNLGYLVHRWALASFRLFKRTSISTPELFSWLRERRALGNPETNCLLIGFCEEKSKPSLIGAFMLARGVSRRYKVRIANFWLQEPCVACSPRKSFTEPCEAHVIYHMRKWRSRTSQLFVAPTRR